MHKHNLFMHEALIEAKIAFALGEVPVGCVIVKDNKIIARAHNLVESTQDVTSHAEVLCIRKASQALNNWRLKDTILYTSLEPCIMCAGAILAARIPLIVWGASEVRIGAAGSWVNVFSYKHPFHCTEVIGNILWEDSSSLLKSFFKIKRVEKNGFK